MGALHAQDLVGLAVWVVGFGLEVRTMPLAVLSDVGQISPLL